MHASQINLFPFTFIASFPSWWSSVFNEFVEATAILHLSGSEISLLKCFLIIIYSEALVFLSHFRAHALEKLVCLAITHYITALSALSLSPKTNVFKCLEQSEAFLESLIKLAWMLLLVSIIFPNRGYHIILSIEAAIAQILYLDTLIAYPL